MDGSQRSEPHVINISIKKGPIDRTFLIGMGAIKYHV